MGGGWEMGMGWWWEVGMGRSCEATIFQPVVFRSSHSYSVHIKRSIRLWEKYAYFNVFHNEFERMEQLWI